MSTKIVSYAAIGGEIQTVKDVREFLEQIDKIGLGDETLVRGGYLAVEVGGDDAEVSLSEGRIVASFTPTQPEADE